MSSDGPRKRPAREEREEQSAARRRERDIRGRDQRDPGSPGGPFGILWTGPHDVAPAGPHRRGRGRGAGTVLTRDEIVRAALKLAGDEGSPDAISMRRIAAELGVGTMSLYHHVPTKDDLLDLMQDVVMGELVISDEELPDNWRDALREISRRTYATFRRHPWMVSGSWERPQMGPRAFAHIEQSLGVFKDFPDLTIQEIGEFLGAADDYVLGFVSGQLAIEQALRRTGMTMDQYQDTLRPYVERLAEEGGFPNLRRFADEPWRVEDEGRFERGLDLMLDGIAAALARRGEKPQ